MHALLIAIIAMSPVQDVRDHADAIIARQLDDGALIHQQDGERITISPYFGNYSALGLFEAYRITGDDKYLEAGIKWTDWYLDHMDVHGVVHDYAGTRGEYKSTGDCDSTDSYAATFLVCANTRRMLTNDFRFVLREQGRLFAVHKAMLATLDVDGLTQAKPGHTLKYTMDNAEVYDALWHSRQIAHVLRDHAWVHECYYTRRKIEKAFDTLRAEDHTYAWAKSGDTLITAADSTGFYPAGLANLFVAAIGPTGWHDAKKTVRATHELYPDLTACPTDHLYWWVIAAQRVHRKDIAMPAFELLKAKAETRGLAVDHACYIRAMSSIKHAVKGPQKTKVLMGSTFIDIPRPATR